MFFYDPGFLIITLVFMLAGGAVGMILKSKMKKYGQIPTSSGLTGAQIAEKMLRENGIYDVQVTATPGFLTDHYHPEKKTVNLSEAVYNQRSVAAAAIAAHECGHAVQHAKGYSPVIWRSKLVPVVQISAMAVQWVLLAGILLINVFPQLLLGGIILFGLTTLFSLVTLPVEVDASKRALVWLESSGITRGQEFKYAKDGLRWAAMTYFVAAIQSLVTLLYYIMIFMNRR